MLKVTVFLKNNWTQCEMIEANKETQSAEIILPSGTHAYVPFRNIQNVASVDDFSGEILENYGAPKNIPELRAWTPQPANVPASRPLVAYPVYFERDYCPDCLIIHYVEKTRSGRIICHGENYYFDCTHKGTHFSRRLGKGFELIAYSKPQTLPLDWQMAEDAMVEQHDNQDY